MTTPEPDLEDFLTFAKIRPKAMKTRQAFSDEYLYNFRVFLATQIYTPKELKRWGIPFGDADSLINTAPLYRVHLKHL